MASVQSLLVAYEEGEQQSMKMMFVTRFNDKILEWRHRWKLCASYNKYNVVYVSQSMDWGLMTVTFDLSTVTVLALRRIVKR